MPPSNNQPQPNNLSSLFSSWLPTIITVASLVYYLGMRDNRQDVDATTIKNLGSKVEQMIQSNILIKSNIDSLGKDIDELKDEITTFGSMKQDVSCLKSAFKTGGDPSKC